MGGCGVDSTCFTCRPVEVKTVDVFEQNGSIDHKLVVMVNGVCSLLPAEMLGSHIYRSHTLPIAKGFVYVCGLGRGESVE